MKVIFLDFDGVLNSEPYLTALKQESNFQPCELSMEWWAQGLDPKNIRRLNDIVGRTGARVVVSSTWRINATVGWLQRILRARGYSYRVYGMTPVCHDCDRSREISRWLESHDVDSFVIIDDDQGAEIDGHFVHASMATGLTSDDVVSAIAILERINPWISVIE